MDFNLHRGSMPQIPPQLPLIVMVPGVFLIALGLLLIYNEHLLVYMVAGTFMLIGAILLLIGWRLRRFVK
ncbi:MAG TPA: hypothetical protein VK348_13890 [Planctomycetota bacterium]|nr:hypothetical protein [Planctomycetota bacterium]